MTNVCSFVIAEWFTWTLFQLRWLTWVWVQMCKRSIILGKMANLYQETIYVTKNRQNKTKIYCIMCKSTEPKATSRSEQKLVIQLDLVMYPVEMLVNP